MRWPETPQMRRSMAGMRWESEQTNTTLHFVTAMLPGSKYLTAQKQKRYRVLFMWGLAWSVNNQYNYKYSTQFLFNVRVGSDLVF